jgi:hypothetical protein
VSRAKTTKQSTEDYILQKKSIKYKLLKEKRESQLKTYTRCRAISSINHSQEKRSAPQSQEEACIIESV